jgi:hypothetical protein
MDESQVHPFPGVHRQCTPFLKGEMMNKRLRDVIDSIDYYELLKIKKDLDEGGIHLNRFIQSEIKKRHSQHHVLCSTCGTEIDSKSSNTSTLVFGPDDFKKKATFCGKDCLEYFIKSMDEMKKGTMPKTTIPEER